LSVFCLKMIIPFETYLAGKKIDSQAFKASEPEKWQEFNDLFEKVHPESFTVQKKFLINKLRRLYLLQTPVTEPERETNPTSVAKPARPVLKRPVLIKKNEE